MTRIDHDRSRMRSPGSRFALGMDRHARKRKTANNQKECQLTQLTFYRI
jgi:hypothetical protein